MALTEEIVKGWRYPDARPELDAIREDVLALLRGKVLKPDEGKIAALEAAIKAKDVEMGTMRDERDAAKKELEETHAALEQAASELDGAKAAFAEVQAERDALAGRVLEVEEALAAEEAGKVAGQ